MNHLKKYSFGSFDLGNPDDFSVVTSKTTPLGTYPLLFKNLKLQPWCPNIKRFTFAIIFNELFESKKSNNESFILKFVRYNGQLCYDTKINKYIIVDRILNNEQKEEQNNEQKEESNLIREFICSPTSAHNKFPKNRRFKVEPNFNSSGFSFSNFFRLSNNNLAPTLFMSIDFNSKHIHSMITNLRHNYPDGLETSGDGHSIIEPNREVKFWVPSFDNSDNDNENETEKCLWYPNKLGEGMSFINQPHYTPDLCFLISQQKRRGPFQFSRYDACFECRLETKEFVINQKSDRESTQFYIINQGIRTPEGNQLVSLYVKFTSKQNKKTSLVVFSRGNPTSSDPSPHVWSVRTYPKNFHTEKINICKSWLPYPRPSLFGSISDLVDNGVYKLVKESNSQVLQMDGTFGHHESGQIISFSQNDNNTSSLLIDIDFDKKQKSILKTKNKTFLILDDKNDDGKNKSMILKTSNNTILYSSYKTINSGWLLLKVPQDQITKHISNQNYNNYNNNQNNQNNIRHDQIFMTKQIKFVSIIISILLVICAGLSFIHCRF